MAVQEAGEALSPGFRWVMGALSVVVLAGGVYFFWIALSRSGRLHAQRWGTRIGVLKPNQSTQNFANQVIGVLIGGLCLIGAVLLVALATGAVQP